MGTASQHHNVADHAEPIDADWILCRLWVLLSQMTQKLVKVVRRSGGLRMCGVGLGTVGVIVEPC